MTRKKPAWWCKCRTRVWVMVDGAHVRRCAACGYVSDVVRDTPEESPFEMPGLDPRPQG